MGGLKRRYREEYRESKARDTSALYSIADGLLKNPRNFESYGVEGVTALAHDLMERGSEEMDYDAAWRGAQLYEKIGKGEKAIVKLNKIVDSIEKYGSQRNRYYVRDFRTERNKFIQKIRSKKQARNGLEGRVSVFILFLLGGLVLSLASLSATGSVVSNLTNTTQGMLGVIFLVVGLAGLVFGKK